MTTKIPSDLIKNAPLFSVAQATVSGSSKDFTGITPNSKKITLILNDVSVSANEKVLYVTIGDAGGEEVSGYSGGTLGAVVANIPSGETRTASFIVWPSPGMADPHLISGHVTLTRLEEGSNVWVMSSVLNGGSALAIVYCAGGSKELSSELTQLSFSTDGVFDNGNVNILVEG